jgi:hypothetical protein
VNGHIFVVPQWRVIKAGGRPEGDALPANQRRGGEGICGVICQIRRIQISREHEVSTGSPR